MKNCRRPNKNDHAHAKKCLHPPLYKQAVRGQSPAGVLPEQGSGTLQRHRPRGNFQDCLAGLANVPFIWALRARSATQDNATLQRHRPSVNFQDSLAGLENITFTGVLWARATPPQGNATLQRHRHRINFGDCLAGFEKRPINLGPADAQRHPGQCNTPATQAPRLFSLLLEPWGDVQHHPRQHEI